MQLDTLENIIKKLNISYLINFIIILFALSFLDYIKTELFYYYFLENFSYILESDFDQRRFIVIMNIIKWSNFSVIYVGYKLFKLITKRAV